MRSRSSAQQHLRREEAVGQVAALSKVFLLIESELHAAIADASQRGVSLRDLAAVLGMSPETVRRKIRKEQELHKT